MRKKGEMTSSQITMLIITIAGFIILLVAIFFILDLRSYSDSEACKVSVLTRATSPDAAQRALPLKCTTSKICLSRNGEDCEAFRGEKGVQTVSLEKDNALAAQTISETTANAIYGCWNMMGEGKLNLFGGGKNVPQGVVKFLKLDVEESSCVVCSRVALSPSVISDTDLLNKTDINNYMATHNVSSTGRTYLDLMSDGEFSSFIPKELSGQFSLQNKSAGVNPTDQIGIIFMQMKTPTDPLGALFGTSSQVGSFLFGGSVAIGGLKALNPYVLSAEAAITATTGTIAAVQTWRSRQISAGYCKKYTDPSKKDAEYDGCSIVTAFDYHDVPNLRAFCGRVEGTP